MFSGIKGRTDERERLEQAFERFRAEMTRLREERRALFSKIRHRLERRKIDDLRKDIGSLT